MTLIYKILIILITFSFGLFFNNIIGQLEYFTNSIQICNQTQYSISNANIYGFMDEKKRISFSSIKPNECSNIKSSFWLSNKRGVSINIENEGNFYEINKLPVEPD